MTETPKDPESPQTNSTYTVKPGDTLSRIAKNMGFTSWNELAKLQGPGFDSNKLRIGQKLKMRETQNPSVDSAAISRIVKDQARAQEARQRGSDEAMMAKNAAADDLIREWLGGIDADADHMNRAAPTPEMMILGANDFGVTGKYEGRLGTSKDGASGPLNKLETSGGVGDEKILTGLQSDNPVLRLSTWRRITTDHQKPEVENALKNLIAQTTTRGDAGVGEVYTSDLNMASIKDSNNIIITSTNGNIIEFATKDNPGKIYKFSYNQYSEKFSHLNVSANHRG